jgi:hypothetical protein
MLRFPKRRAPWLTACCTVFQHADALEVDFLLWERHPAATLSWLEATPTVNQLRCP